jgi:hypothetical protein
LVFIVPKLIILRSRIKHLLKNAVKGITSKGKTISKLPKNVERLLQTKSRGEVPQSHCTVGALRQ